MARPAMPIHPIQCGGGSGSVVRCGLCILEMESGLGLVLSSSPSSSLSCRLQCRIIPSRRRPRGFLPTPQRILVDADKISSPPSIVIQPQRAAAAVPAASGRSRSCRARAAQKQSPSPPPPRAPRDSQAVVAHHGAPRVALSAMASDKYRQQSVPCTVAYV
jgi:hypothetical protein